MAPRRSGAGVTDLESGFATAISMARAIRERAITAVELVDLHAARLDRFNPSLNAVVIRNPEARARAVEADAALARGESWGPLHGVPVTIKDIFDTRGLRTTGGYPPARDNVRPRRHGHRACPRRRRDPPARRMSPALLRLAV
jgi:amidase